MVGTNVFDLVMFDVLKELMFSCGIGALIMLLNITVPKF